MRLLKLQNGNGDLTFTQDLSSNIPPYAILSHTWGADEEEVNYKDILKGRGKAKIGHRKIQFCLEQASRDRLEYIWIDTCCIDKSNSVELNRAINSMFLWYQQASRCYVYLPDVSTGTLHPDTWKLDFQKTRWATRGWTLQELLAPPSVEFFSSSGQRLGDKSSLEALLHDMTKIPIGALRGNPLSDYSEIERMSWMDGRRTRDEEDMIYALLGLFNVHIIPNYGERREGAYHRFKEAIAGKATGGLPSHSTEAPKPHLITTLDRNPEFVDRTDILDQLIKKIDPATNDLACHMTVIEGMGGIGKTQLALEAAFRIHERSHNCSVFWVPAVDKITIDNAYRSIGQALQIPTINDDKANVKTLVKDALTTRDNGYWLLIVDNADDRELLFGEDDLRDYIPSHPRGSVLITTRNHDLAVDLDIGRNSLIVVERMSPMEALQLLEKKLSPTQLHDRDSTQKLLEFLTFLPLAIRQASAYMFATESTAKEYLETCYSSDANEIKLLSQPFGDRSRYLTDWKSANPVTTTWLISFKHIAKDHPLASRYLRFLCCLAEKDIPISLLPQYEGDLEKRLAIIVLKKYGFVSGRDDSSSLDIHRLVRLAMKNWMNQGRDDCIIEVVQQLSHIYPDPSSNNKDVWLRYLPHGDAALDLWMERCEHKHDDAAWRLLINTGQSHFILGKAQLAEGRYRQASKISEEMRGLEHSQTITSINSLSIALRQQAKYPEAEERQRQVLQSSIRALGHDDAATLAIKNGLAEVLRQSGRYQLAEEEQQQTLEQCSRVLGGDHPNTLASMNNLIIICYQKGDHQQAGHLCQQLLQTKSQLGHEHVDIVSSMNSQAIILDQQGNYEEAEKLHKETLQLSRKTWGADHPETMASVTNLASVLYRQRRFREAEEQHQLAIRTITKELTSGHPDALANTNGLAEALRHQGRHHEAERLHRKTLQAITKTLGSKHPSTLFVKTNLAATLIQCGNLEEAEALYSASRESKVEVLGHGHPSTITSTKGLANVLMLRKRYQDAESQYEEVLELRIKSLGTQHPLAMASRNDLAVARHMRLRQEDLASQAIAGSAWQLMTWVGNQLAHFA